MRLRAICTITAISPARAWKTSMHCAPMFSDWMRSRAQGHEKSMEIGAIQVKQAEHKKYLEQEKTGHAKLLERISSQADQQRREIGKLKHDEERLARLVEKIAKMLAQKKRNSRP